MSKKSFRTHRASTEASAEYPTWSDAGSRRSFLVTLGKAAAGSALASLALACGDDRAVPTDAGPPDQPPTYYTDGFPSQPDVCHPPYKDQGAAPMMDIPRPPPPDLGPPDLGSGGVPDQPPSPPDMWPHFSDGVAPQPDVYWPPANDAGGPPMPPAPRDRKKK